MSLQYSWPTRFIQQFGVLYYWTVRICDVRGLSGMADLGASLYAQYTYYATCMPSPTGSYETQT